MSEAFAPAKVNLALHVTGLREDGYHLLDSLVVFADVGDRLRVTEGDGLHLSVTGPMAAGVPVDERNSILQAARFLGQDELSFELEKHLPSAAGIGGGTSDAAAALRAVAALRGVQVPEDLLPLGADMPVCAFGHAALMRGIGENVVAVEGLPDLYCVLVNPGVAVPTGAVFNALARKNNPPMDPLPVRPGFGEFVQWLVRQRNDLEPAAIAVQPVIGDVLRAIAGTKGCGLARMSGSGATCFGLYATAPEAEAAAGALKRDGWWVVAARLS
ncbi:MAG: 4-(cytidine 5'-diphospho)-2-C-methyl-D-erythritol kinase [Thalassovita sp.]|nr:4-(cytidine 5'-diphospho)-2-C-methyl-D-erythritol kinase [Thalassovita sp.]